MVFPSYGLITAAATFSTHAGHAFKAAYDYIYYEDFRVGIPRGLQRNEKGWHANLKMLIVDNKAISPQMWQQMSRFHSATFLHEQIFNLPVEFQKTIDQVLFGKETIPLSERIERGLFKYVTTQTLLLTLFVMMFSYVFRNQE